MADLMARTPFEGLLPLRHGTVEAAEWQPAAITSVAPLRGQADAVSARLEAGIGLGLPQVGQWWATGPATVVWTGLDQWIVLGPQPGPLEGAAITDQSDAWACATLAGAGVDDVLARLSPIDLRQDAFLPGRAARTLLGHMPCILMRFAPDRFGVMVFRSMAGSAGHELDRAMRLAAARAGRD